MNRNYYIAGFTWDGDSQLERFKKEHIWENGYEEKYEAVYNTMRVGDHIALKSTYVKNSKSYLRIYCMGVIKKIHADNMKVEVDWKECRKDLTDITWYVHTLCKIDNEEHIKRIFNMDNYEETKQDLAEFLTANYNLIFTGAPGTGKTYLAKQIAVQMILGCEYDENNVEHKKKMDEQFDFVQFHPSYDYTDFIEGLRPVQDELGNIGFKREDGVFMAFCRKALKAYNEAENKDDAPKYIFVIDEINRGELSKIFGELFFSIDPGYRGSDGKVNGKVKTQYSNLWKSESDMFDGGKSFFIPKNVYIIGTMNDIDRSVESMDFAMRRRFAFQEIDAQNSFSMIGKNTKLSVYSDQIKERMENLNNCILTVQGLNTAYQIGAAYFLKLENYLDDNGQITPNSWESLWNNHIKGLLFEYLRGLPNAESDITKLKDAYDLKKKYEVVNDKN